MNKDNIFKKEPPIDGGTFFNSKNNLIAREQVIKQNYLTTRKIDESIRKHLSSANFTYNFWWLLQQQADYFTNLVPFRFYNQDFTTAIYKAIRCGVIYGRSALWYTSQGLIPLYINEIKYDGIYGRPIYMKAALVDNVFAQKELEPKINQWLTFENNEFENIYIFNSSSLGFGGLIRWAPFLKQLENLLKMLYTHSYSYLKFVLYDIKDPAFIEKEMELFFNLETPFLVNLGDDSLIRNKFKEFNFNNTNKNDFFEYVNNFMNIYYSLIGRRYNIDQKKERNVSSEIAASQDNFDILQNELKQYIYLMLDWVKVKTGFDYIDSSLENKQQWNIMK